MEALILSAFPYIEQNFCIMVLKMILKVILRYNDFTGKVPCLVWYM